MRSISHAARSSSTPKQGSRVVSLSPWAPPTHRPPPGRVLRHRQVARRRLRPFLRVLHPRAVRPPAGSPPRAGRAVIGWQSTARRRRPGASVSRTDASTPREADLRYLMKTVPLGTSSRYTPSVTLNRLVRWKEASPSCTPTSAARWPRRSCGRSRTSRGSRSRSRTTGSSTARHRLRPARRPRPDALDADLPLDGADPVEPARGRALRARGDRRRLPLAADHDARAALQPDEAKPRRRARPRPHHHGRGPRARPREPRVPAGARRPDPDDGPDVHRAAERDHRREGDPLRAARHRRHRHRRPAARRRGPTPTATSRRSSSRRARPASA